MRGRGARILLALTLIAAAGLAQEPPPFEVLAEWIAEGLAERAEGELRKVLASEESAPAHYLLGVALRAQGRWQESVRELERAVEIAPDDEAAVVELARTLLRTDPGERALAALRRAAELGHLDRSLALELARRELALGNVLPAERQLRSVVERFDSPRALLDLARLEARRGQEQEALAHLNRALELAPNSEDLLSAHARVALAVDAPVTAIDTLEALTRMHPSVADYAYLLGVARFEIADSNAAIEALERSIDLDPEQGRPYVALGLALVSVKRFDQAKDALRRSLQLLPGNVDALVALAEAQLGLGEMEAAERGVQRALELASEAPAALFVLGKIRMRQARYEEARDALERSVARDPGSSKAHYQLSLVYSRLGERERAASQLALYREALAAEQERLADLLTEAGLGLSGMRGGGG